LEELVFASEELQPKESIKELEKHLARMKNQIKGRSRTCVNPATNEAIIIPGRVTHEEHLMMDQISWEISSWHETSKQVGQETKSAKEEIENMKKKLKRLSDTRDLTEESVEYAIDRTLCDNGVDRKVYHGKCLIGPQIQKLLANRVAIMGQLESKFLRVRLQNLSNDPNIDLASIEEIKEEMRFFQSILACYDSIFGLLRRKRTIITPEEKHGLGHAIDRLKVLWPTQRVWEKKAASVTPKSHDLWFEVPQQLTYLGRFYHFMEDPIEKLHKIDRQMDTVFCHLRDYEFREDSKRRHDLIGNNTDVKIQMEKVDLGRKRKFTKPTLLRKKEKNTAITIIKQERRSVL
jgi:hypothetical protein